MLSNSYVAMLALGGPAAGGSPEDQKKNMFMQVGMMVFFGIMGYVFKKLDYPLAPLVLALVLGDRADAGGLGGAVCGGGVRVDARDGGGCG